MKMAAIGMVGLLMLGAGRAAQNASGFSGRNYEVFTGQISDSICAEGHHIDAIKSEKNCILTCVKFDGAQFVLSNRKTKRNFKLDDQRQPEAFAGQEVIVTGSYDKDANVIHVVGIRPLITFANPSDSASFHRSRLLR
jgi:Protein of unknown function (DUF5818)